MKQGFHVRYTPYTDTPRLELCFEAKPIAEYDATPWSASEAEGIATMLNRHIRGGEQLSKEGWEEVGIINVPRNFRITYRNLWRN